MSDPSLWLQRAVPWLLCSTHLSAKVPETFPQVSLAWEQGASLLSEMHWWHWWWSLPKAHKHPRDPATQCFATSHDLSWGLWVIEIINCTSKNKGSFARTRSERGCPPYTSEAKEFYLIDSDGSWCNVITSHIGRFWASTPWKVKFKYSNWGSIGKLGSEVRKCVPGAIMGQRTDRYNSMASCVLCCHTPPVTLVEAKKSLGGQFAWGAALLQTNLLPFMAR